jgi:serine/threonine protein kinase/tetratricopeptide (TPR) repeat protein
MPDTRELHAGDQIGRYVIVRPLGRGGMGVVYVARDERLGRDVALKMIAGLPDDTARSRFWREARAAASVNHPNICQVFEVDESADGVFLTMELLEGESMDRRLIKGTLSPQDAVPIARGMLGALGALHARGFVHRDIKPSNVFLTPHGPKLLDFGLARPALLSTAHLPGAHTSPITDAGIIVGTPQYMAPEQVTGAALDGRTDLYAVGAVMFHMLAGRPPFTGLGPDVLFAAMKENPPALQGPPAVIAIDRVIRRAMRKNPDERYGSAAAMAAELSAVSLSGAQGAVLPVRALTRIIVPPLRIPKTDPDVAYLAFGLAEAVSGSLATLSDVVVRAPALAARWADETIDPRQLAVNADVDLVVSNTLLRSGGHLRITSQLLDASSSTVVGSTTVKGSMDDIFALEDALTTAVVTLLTPHLTSHPSRHEPPAVRREVPASPRAFELFLRGMEQARELSQIVSARDLFQQAREDDPRFAPAWAALGRCHRVYGKYFEERDSNDRRAEQAFKRALEISPDLPLAHRYLTHFESEHGRAGEAIARLLHHARTNRQDAQLFAGLVHACRYAGLLDASLAAHDEAVRLDPNVATSVEYTLAHFEERVDQAAALTSPEAAGLLEGIFPAIALGSPSNARAIVSKIDGQWVPPAFRSSFDAVLAFAQKPAEEALRMIERGIAAHVDPEALFIFGVMLMRLGALERGLEVVGGAVESGYTPVSTLRRNHAFDPLRPSPAFARVEEAAARMMSSAKTRFEAGGGPELLGLPAVTRLA